MSGQVDERIFAYLADEIAEDELIALEASLRDDPATARRFARLCRSEAALTSLMRGSVSARQRAVPSARRPRLRRRFLSRPWIAVAAALVLGIGMLVMVESRAARTPAVASVAELGGTASVRRDGVEQPLGLGDALLAGDRIAVAPGSRVGLVLGDGTAIDLGAGAVLGLPADASKRFLLALGEAKARVAHQAAGAPLAFASAHGEAEVVGTRLRLVVDDRSTRLEVEDGRVRFTRGADAASVLVEAGCAATATASAAFPLGIERLAPLSERLPAGARILLRMDAAAPGGWEGQPGRPADALAGPPALGSIRPQPGTRFCGEIRSPQLADLASGDQTYLGFRYFAEGFRAGDLVKLMLKGADGVDHHGFVVAEPGGWREAVVRLDGAFADLDRHSEPLRPGVAIGGLVFLGAALDGRTAAPGSRLWVAEAVVFTAAGPVETVPVEQK